MYKHILYCVAFYFYCLNAFSSADLVKTIAAIKPAVVGIGVHTPTGRPQNVIYGSGFAVADGTVVVTNKHVIPKNLDDEKLQTMAVFVGFGKAAQVRFANVIATDEDHDLALLKIKGKPLPTMRLASDKYLAEGSSVGFTGFPIGSILGLYPVTHRGIISAITPTIVPVADAQQLSINMLKRLRDPYMVYQLDATAYPGNSGSALYEIKTGAVIGIINKVFVQQSKEAVIEHPSGITYAIPVKYLHSLLRKHHISKHLN